MKYFYSFTMLKTISRFPALFTELSPLIKRFGNKVLPSDPLVEDEIPVLEIPSKSAKETSLYGWGLADHGALGHLVQKKGKKKLTDKKYTCIYRPLRLNFGELHKVKHIAAGYGFSAFSVKSKSQKKVYGTGLNTDSQIGFHTTDKNVPYELLMAPLPINLRLKQPGKTKVTALAAGRAHLVILTDLEGIFTLGNNSYGQCGRTIIENEEYAGSNIVHNIKHLDKDPVTQVECGQDHTLFLTESGKVYAFGWGADGQTGLGHYNNNHYPERVLGDIEGEKIVKLSSKCDCVLALNDKGEIFGWGNSEYGQLFDHTDSLQQINRPIHLKKCENFGKIVDIAAGGSHCVMLNDGGEVFSWGYGILGQGPNVSQSWVPKIIPSILLGKNEFLPDSRVKSVYCGLGHTAAITNHGELYTWGKNRGSCLGHGDKKDYFFPWRVCISSSAKTMSLGVDHTLALCHPFG